MASERLTRFLYYHGVCKKKKRPFRTSFRFAAPFFTTTSICEMAPSNPSKWVLCFVALFAALASAEETFAVVDAANGELRTRTRLLTDEVAQLKQSLCAYTERCQALQNECTASKVYANILKTNVCAMLTQLFGRVAVSYFWHMLWVGGGFSACQGAASEVR